MEQKSAFIFALPECSPLSPRGESSIRKPLKGFFVMMSGRCFVMMSCSGGGGSYVTETVLVYLVFTSFLTFLVVSYERKTI